jgi:hypothetical protein
MVFRVLVFLLLVLNPISSFLQNVEVTFGPIYKYGSKTKGSEVIGQDENGVYVMNYTRLFREKGYVFELYDNALNLVLQKDIILPVEGMEIDDIMMIEGEIVVFITYFNKETNINYLYGSTISTQGELNYTMFEIAAVAVESSRKLNDFLITLAQDSSTFLITITPFYEKKVNQEAYFIIVEHNFTIRKEIPVKFKFKQRDFYLETVELSKDGNIHIMASTRNLEDNFLNRSRDLRLFTYFSLTDELHEYEVKIGDNYITNYKIKSAPNGNMIISGFYSDYKYNTMKGVFFLELDTATKTFIHSQTTDFTEAFLSEFMSKRKAEKGRELMHFEVRELYFKENGEIQFLAEYYEYFITYNYDQNGLITSTTEHFMYRDVIVANLSETGSVNWWVKIPKLQHATNAFGAYAGMNYTFLNNKIYLIYNEHQKNTTSIKPEVLRNIHRKKSWTVLVTIDDKGNVIKTPLFASRDRKTLLKPQYAVRTSEKEQVMVSGIGKNYRFCRIKLN